MEETNVTNENEECVVVDKRYEEGQRLFWRNPENDASPSTHGPLWWDY